MQKIIISVIIILVIAVVFYNYNPIKKLSSNIVVDSILVLKSKRELIAFSNGIAVKTYKIALGKQPIGSKEIEGDNKTPEGIYTINDKNENSAFYKNLGVSYPNELQIENAKRVGKNPGGDIKIHGLRNGIGFLNKFHRLFDWTAGCIAVTNEEIDELYNAVPIGTKIEIRP